MTSVVTAWEQTERRGRSIQRILCSKQRWLKVWESIISGQHFFTGQASSICTAQRPDLSRCGSSSVCGAASCLHAPLRQAVSVRTAPLVAQRACRLRQTLGCAGSEGAEESTGRGVQARVCCFGVSISLAASRDGGRLRYLAGRFRRFCLAPSAPSPSPRPEKESPPSVMTDCRTDCFSRHSRTSSRTLLRHSRTSSRISTDCDLN